MMIMVLAITTMSGCRLHDGAGDGTDGRYTSSLPSGCHHRHRHHHHHHHHRHRHHHQQESEEIPPDYTRLFNSRLFSISTTVRVTNMILLMKMGMTNKNADGNDKYYADGNDKYYADGNAYDCIFQPGCSTSNPSLQGAWGETRTTQVRLKHLKCYQHQTHVIGNHLKCYRHPNSCYQRRLITPQFETPLPPLQAAVFPPQFRNLPDPQVRFKK